VHLTGCRETKVGLRETHHRGIDLDDIDFESAPSERVWSCSRAQANSERRPRIWPKSARNKPCGFCDFMSVASA
jgi:hypothetical protein